MFDFLPNAGAPLPGPAHLRAGFLPLRSGGAKPPLFVVQGRGDTQLDLAALTAHLAGAMPVYQLCADADEASSTRQGIAARLLSTILRVQPGGPYRLAGVGRGGPVAYEIGLLILGLDQRVDFVGLVGEQQHQEQDLPMPAAALRPTLFHEHAHAGWSTHLPGLRVKPLARGNQRIEARALGGELVAMAADAQGRTAPASELEYHPHVVIQTGRRGHAPLFCIPGAGDSVTGFASLAGALGQDWPVHGLQPRGVDGQLAPHATVEAAAAMYLQAIEAVQPEGPLHLLGHSFGGWIAFHIACRLQAAGRAPASLTLVDSEAPGTDGVLGQEYSAFEVVERFVQSLGLVAERPLPVDRAALALADDAGRLRLVHAAAVQIGLMPARSRPEMLLGPLRTFGAALRTVYRPTVTYAGAARVVLIPDTRLDAGHNERQYRQAIEGWGRWLPGLAHWKGPGNHMTVLRPPHVGELARWWLDGLSPRKVQPRTSDSSVSSD